MQLQMDHPPMIILIVLVLECSRNSNVRDNRKNNFECNPQVVLLGSWGSHPYLCGVDKPFGCVGLRYSSRWYWIKLPAVQDAVAIVHPPTIIGVLWFSQMLKLQVDNSGNKTLESKCEHLSLVNIDTYVICPSDLHIFSRKAIPFLCYFVSLLFSW